MKKIGTLLLALLMVCSIFTPALAVEQEADIELVSGQNAVRLPLRAAEENAARFQETMEQARVQAINRDRTPLSQPVEWRFLWIAHTHIRVEGDNRDFRLTPAERNWLYAIAAEFKEAVESAVACITIRNSVVFVEDLLTIPREPHTMIGDHFAISQRVIQSDLDRLNVVGNYDIVLTAMPSRDVFFGGGFAAATITSGFGYGGITICAPRHLRPGEMIWGTRVAVHEWLHMLEGTYKGGFLPGVPFPNVHGYLPYPRYDSYGRWSYCPDTGNWPYYRAILQGRLLYNNRYEIGMFPNMWRLTPRAINAGVRADLGTYTIRTADGRYLFRDDIALRAGAFRNNDDRFLWTVRRNATGGYTISPGADSHQFLDVVNAWAFAGNTVAVWNWTGVVGAPTWELRATNDAIPSYRIVSRLASNLTLGIDTHGDARLFYTGGDANQRWLFRPATPPTGLPFIDVFADAWYFPYIETVYTRDVMNGTSAITFAPYETFSRAQVLATLFRIHHGRVSNANDPRGNNFTDVGDDWYAPYVTWAANNGITVTTSGTFLPHRAAERQEIALFIHRYVANLTDFNSGSAATQQWNAFTDRGWITGTDNYNALRWANNHGIIRGINRDGMMQIAPQDTASRAEAAAMLVRLMDLDI